MRKRTIAWFLTENIRHTWLFQVVVIDDPAEVARFRQGVTRGHETCIAGH